jgi:hypothetical protein
MTADMTSMITEVHIENLNMFRPYKRWYTILPYGNVGRDVLTAMSMRGSVLPEYVTGNTVLLNHRCESLKLCITITCLLKGRTVEPE